ncbi:MAG: 50S ribosomal protein L29 [DPANN group archaeon]|nr:50S ribosomal protein L29 [DPANN group archaeon]
MAILRVKEIIGMGKKEQDSKMLELQKEMIKIRSQITTGAVKETAKVRNIRRTIARILTLQKMSGGSTEKK